MLIWQHYLNVSTKWKYRHKSWKMCHWCFWLQRINRSISQTFTFHLITISTIAIVNLVASSPPTASSRKRAGLIIHISKRDNDIKTAATTTLYKPAYPLANNNLIGNLQNCQIARRASFFCDIWHDKCTAKCKFTNFSLKRTPGVYIFVIILSQQKWVPSGVFTVHTQGNQS